MGMCAVVLFLFLYNLARFVQLRWPQFLGERGGLFLLGFHALFLWGCVILYGVADVRYSDPHCETTETLLLGSLISATLIGMVYFNIHSADTYVSDHRLFAIGVGTLLLGVTAHKFDVHKIICWPDSVLQMHAAWHILTSQTLLFTYLYMRSQIRRTRARIKRIQ